MSLSLARFLRRSPGRSSGGSPGGALAPATLAPTMWRRLAVLVLLPLLVLGVLGWAFASSPGEDAQPRAAVVNADEPVEVDDELAPIGRELAGKLTQSDGRFAWELTDPAGARSGLADGSYAAVATIPEEFSAAVTSTATEDPLAASRALLDVEFSSEAGLADPFTSRQEAEAQVEELSREVIRDHIERLYGVFAGLHTDLGEAVDGADELAGGADELDGGAGELAEGARQADEGAGELAGGAGELASGIGELGAGADELAGGLGEAREQTAELPELTAALADGAGQVAEGNRQLAETVTPLADRVIEATEALPSGEESAERLRGLAQRCGEGAGGGAGGGSGGAGGSGSGGEGGSGGERAQGEQAEGEQDGSAAEGEQAPEDAAAEEPARESPAGAASAAFCAELDELADQVEAQAATLDSGREQVRGAATDARDAVTGLADGAEQVADGTAELADQADELTGGIAEAAGGAEQLAGGLGEAGAGADELAVGAGELAGGTGELRSGASELAEGTGEVAGGAAELAGELDSGREQIPDYDDAQREHLAGVAAHPAATQLAGAPDFGRAAIVLFTVLGLWTAALATYLVLPAVPPGALTSRASGGRLTVAAAAPGAVLAVASAGVLTAVLWPLLELGPGRAAGMFGVLTLGAATFLALNQVLAGWFGHIGRLISLGVLLVSAASAVVSTVPPALGSVAAVLPTGGALSAVTALVPGTGGGFAGLAGLAVWLAVAAVALIAVVERARTVPAARLQATG